MIKKVLGGIKETIRELVRKIREWVGNIRRKYDMKRDEKIKRKNDIRMDKGRRKKGKVGALVVIGVLFIVLLSIIFGITSCIFVIILMIEVGLISPTLFLGVPGFMAGVMTVLIVLFLGILMSISLLFRRLRSRGKQFQYQEKHIHLEMAQQLDNRFTIAVNRLGSKKTSTRTGAIYSLYQLAIEEKKYRSQIVQILCSHVRSNTSERKYRKRYKDRPSNEIQTTINLLLRDDNGTGLYWDFEEKLSPPDFTHAYLAGVNFYKANCKKAIFMGAECRGANFFEAQCQEAYFYEAQCQGAKFYRAQCQGAYFTKAYCQSAYFTEAQCQGVRFDGAQCPGVNFSGAQCQEAEFFGAQCQGAYAAGNQSLSGRIGKPTELDGMIMAGKLSEDAVRNIGGNKGYCAEPWYAKMQGVIERNEARGQERSEPKGIVKGVLEDGPELQVIINEDWEKLAAIVKRGK